MQWEHYGPEEATWELENVMILAHPFFVQFCKALRTILMKGKGNVTPWFSTHCIKIVHDVYIVFKYWQGAQFQGPAIDLVFCV